MPTTKHGQELNHSMLLALPVGESAGFISLDIPKNNVGVISITGVDWGSIVINSMDRTNFINQWVAILMNVAIDDTVGFSRNAPIDTQIGENILWMNSRNAAGAGPGMQADDFSNPFELSPGDDVSIYLSMPNFSAALAGPMYIALTVRGFVKYERDRTLLGYRAR